MLPLGSERLFPVCPRTRKTTVELDGDDASGWSGERRTSGAERGVEADTRRGRSPVQASDLPINHASSNLFLSTALNRTP